MNLIQVKIFKSTDAPNAPNITQEEYLKIQEEVKKNPHIFKVEEIRKKEINMDIKQQPEPEIQWKLPPMILIENNNENNEKNDLGEVENCELGKDSKEKDVIKNLCDSVLKINYFDDKIPDPPEGDSKLFSFTDDNIPKIENSKVATKTNDIKIEDVLAYLDSLGNNMNEETLKNFEDLLSKVEDVDENNKKMILDKAKKRFEENMNDQNNQNPNNNININNNVTINNNQRILSMNQYPNLMNFNNINQMAGALSFMNNYKPPISEITPLPQTPILPQTILNNSQNNFLNKHFDENNNNQNNNNNMNFNNYYPNNNMNYNTVNMNNNNNLKQNNSSSSQGIDPRMFMESMQRMNMQKYKTKPCRNYHGTTGCTRGDNCFFIHDVNYKGREIPNFDLRNYQRNLPIQLPGIMGNPLTQQMNTQINNQFNPLNMNPLNMGFNLQQMMNMAGNFNNMNNQQNMNKAKEEEDMDKQYDNGMKINNMMNNNLINNQMNPMNMGNIGGMNYNNNSQGLYMNRQMMDNGMNYNNFAYNPYMGINNNQNMQQGNNGEMIINNMGNNGGQNNGM